MHVREHLAAESTRVYDGVNSASYIVIHETDNENPGADADAHARLQAGGNVREASWHETTDDTESVISFPPTTQCWHAGDGRGRGNLEGYAIEICVHAGIDYVQAVRNAAQRVRELRAQGIGLLGVLTHKDTSGKNCPRRLLAGTHGITYPEFLALAGVTTTGGSRMHSPIRDGRVTSRYGHRTGGFHGGMDLAPQDRKATEVYASFAGEIVRIVRSRKPGQRNRVDELAPSRTGNGLIVRNPDGEMQLYGHVAVLADLRVGDTVRAGQLLGVTDLSGNTTGHHVHYEEWTSGSTIAKPTTRDPQASFDHFEVAPGSDTGQGAAPQPIAVPKPQPVAVIRPTSPAPTSPAASAPRAFPAIELVVDGDFGGLTVRALQAVIPGGLRVDGDFGPLTKRTVQTWLKGLGYYGGNIDGDFGPMSVKALQSFLRAKGKDVGPADGSWGPRTTRALQAYLNDQRRYL